MADKTYIQFTGRLKATSQEGILAEAQQIAISGSDNTNVKKYIDDKISSVNNNIGSVAGSVYRPKGSITFAGLRALASATAGDVYNVTDAFTLGSKSYPAGSNVACLKSFSSAVTPNETYWDVLAGFVDLSPYAKTSEVNTIKGNLEKSISDNVSALTSKVGTAQATANEASSAASTNAGEITKIKTRVSSLEGVGAQANVIESVKVNGSALPVSNKSVNVDLSSYAKSLDLNSVRYDVNAIGKGVLLRFYRIFTPLETIKPQTIKCSGSYGGFPDFDPNTKTFYILSGGQLYSGWTGFDDIPDAATYSAAKLFIGKTYDGVFSKNDYAIYERKADHSLEKLELNSAKSDTLESQTQALEQRVTALENLLKLA